MLFRRLKKCRTAFFLVCSLVFTAVCVIEYGEKLSGNEEGAKQETENVAWTFDADSYILYKRSRKDSTPYQKHAFNIRASDGTPVDRDIPDSRDPTCEARESGRSFSGVTVSVIISFHNEARSALLRTVVSILNRSPEDILKEIILVDDYSDDASDGLRLAGLPKVNLSRNSRREGLIRSRALGAELANGDYLVFLDSHCEANTGWMEPLLDAIIQHPKTLVSPVIDIIDQDTFEYRASSDNIKGGFDWGLNFRWLPLTEREKSTRGNRNDPFKSPVLPGGLFMVKKSWLKYIGGFDKGLEIWGAENIELSLKTWLCGGQVIVQPCSRVGHVFRKRHPYSFPKNNSAALFLRNVRRVAEVWLDEYKRDFFEAMPKAKKEILVQLEDQISNKKTLKCKPFQWFLNEIYPELRPLIKDVTAFGQMRQGDRCLQVQSKQAPVFHFMDCAIITSKQTWSFSKTGQLQLSNMCLTADVASNPRVTLSKCTNQLNQKWTRKRRLLVHKDSNLCLESSTNFQHPTLLVLSPCYRKAYTQQWDFTMELQSWDDR